MNKTHYDPEELDRIMKAFDTGDTDTVRKALGMSTPPAKPKHPRNKIGTKTKRTRHKKAKRAQAKRSRRRNR